MRASASNPFEGIGVDRRRARVVLVRMSVGIAMVLAVVSTSIVGVAAERPAEAQGCGPVLTVSKSQGLDPNGETVSVSGSCFDVDRGIYIGFCVVPAPGSPPSPCGGGVTMEGSGGLSHWISSNPPPYAVGLTTPYGPGGSFSVTLRPSAMLNPEIDCRVVQCAISTRNDHTRSSDRGQDGVVPVSFAPPTAPLAPEPEAPPVSAAPESAPASTTTAVPEPTTTLPPTTTTTEPAAVADDAELASAAGDSGGSVGGWIAAIVLVVLLTGGATGLVLRRRRSADGPR